MNTCKHYQAPHITCLPLQLQSHLLSGSNGMPTEADGSLTYESGPSGSFDSDESVAVKGRYDWDFDWK